MPLMQQDITKVSSTETTGLDERGYARAMRRTTFMVRGQGPYSIELPKAGWTADEADKAIKEAASEIIALLDKYPQG